MSQKYDLRMRAPSIGGGFEPWAIASLFCSPLGSGLPDPTGKICKLFPKYENDELSIQDLEGTFLKQIERDSAILPIAHFGLQWYLSPGVKRDSISPLVSIIRFDDLELE
jgi:hypothetical protein